ncbi:MAG: hypothetical protein JXA37_13570 [Chloroflexia bacterium]|nr:hypothetical protein [Chloroflexia bacterium]
MDGSDSSHKQRGRRGPCISGRGRFQLVQLRWKIYQLFSRANRQSLWDRWRALPAWRFKAAFLRRYARLNAPDYLLSGLILTALLMGLVSFPGIAPVLAQARAESPASNPSSSTPVALLTAVSVPLPAIEIPPTPRAQAAPPSSESTPLPITPDPVPPKQELLQQWRADPSEPTPLPMPPQPRQIELLGDGWAAHYAPEVMSRVINSRLQGGVYPRLFPFDSRHYVGFVARPDCGEVGQEVWLDFGKGWVGPFLVTDCARSWDRAYIEDRGIVAELDYKSAEEFGVTRTGGHKARVGRALDD